MRTKGVKRAASTSKRSHLEDKIEDLVDLLRTQQASSSLQVGTSTGSMLTPISSYQSPRYWGENTMEDFFLTEDELAYFRGYHLKHFPFIFLPTASTAEQLQSTRPMFCLAIKTICNKAHSVQSRLSQKCREQLAHRLLVEGEKDFDILLGITTCMVW